LRKRIGENPALRMFRATIGVANSSWIFPLRTLASLVAAAATLRKPLPWSMAPEPSPSAVGLAERISASRIWNGLDEGEAPTRSAAAPATVGPENDVPETRLIPPFALWA
jgi:hypothetical protein